MLKQKKKMDLEFKLRKTDQNMLDIGNQVNLMVLEDIFMLKEIYLKDIVKMVKLVNTEFLFSLMEGCIQDTGKMI